MTFKGGRILWLVVAFLFAILLMICLYLISPRINSKKNGFIRLFPPHKLDYLRDIKLDKNAYYLVSVKLKQIYLANSLDPTFYICIDTGLKQIHVNLLKYSIDKSIAPRFIRVVIDSTSIIVFDGNTPVAWEGKLNNPFLRLLQMDSTRFLNSVSVSNNSYIIRTYDSKLGQTILLKKSYTSSKTETVSYKLEKQQDGFFSPDGMLEYNSDAHILIYTYFYHNKFVCLDTNLATRYSGYTIDTVSHPTLNVIVDKSKKLSSILGDAIVVNKISTTSDHYLFIQSGLLANNEDMYLFKNASIVDLYDTRNGSYLYSFYIPHFQNQKIREFKVTDNRLFALYDDYLVAYRFNF